MSRSYRFLAHTPEELVAKLGEAMTDAKLDRLLAERLEEVEALLEEARKEKAEGRCAPLEPLHEFLRRARERFNATR